MSITAIARMEQAMKVVVRETVTEADLRRSGFTGEQISMLKELRTLYPLIELVRSREELNRLGFVKWQYQTGRIEV